MSVSAVLPGVLQAGLFHQPISQKSNGFQSEFQQLGQDLQSGNLTAAQTDFTTLTSQFPLLQQSGTNQLSQDFAALSQALQAGSLTSAQNAYKAVQQDFQQGSSTAPGGHEAHSHHTSAMKEFNALGQALQSGNLAAAQQAYLAAEQDFAGGSSAAQASAVGL
jgi:hypothetical protein